MANSVLDLLFAWAGQQTSEEQQKLSVKVWGISSVSVFPPAAGYGMGTLSYTPPQWKNLTPSLHEPSFLFDYPATFQGAILMPQWEHGETGAPPGNFSAVEVPMVITTDLINLFPHTDSYHVTFYEPPQRFTAVGSPTNVPLTSLINVGDVRGSVSCTLPGDAFAFQFAAVAV